jgi:nucleotide-binding universal stress UspA family protein
MTQFTFNDSNLLDGVLRGYGRVEVRVHGYWSDVITLYVNRKGWDDSQPNWEVSLSHSSGGRDPKVVECDLEAESNFATTLLATAEYGKTLKARFGEFEEMYQAERKKERLALEAEKAASQKLVDADAPLGEKAAKVLAFRLANQTNAWDADTVVIVKRGSSDSDRWTSTLTARLGKKVSYMLNGNRISRDEAVQYLSNSSHRTHYAEAN